MLVVAGIALLALLVGRPDPAARLVSASPVDGDRLDRGADSIKVAPWPCSKSLS
ncbi:hypothetical protein [Actinoplanes solisilvae]|uniref:hypothetical protein n=1 Tax=Actinoplanes solisilvae TaxID=2486853 RepID=UPI0013E35273|nr:hypothetical protein [Actinoplanes solisilvae]